MITTFDLYVFVRPFLGVTDKIVEHVPVFRALTDSPLILQIFEEALEIAIVIFSEAEMTMFALAARHLREINALFFTEHFEIVFACNATVFGVATVEVVVTDGVVVPTMGTFVVVDVVLVVEVVVVVVGVVVHGVYPEVDEVPVPHVSNRPTLKV